MDRPRPRDFRWLGGPGICQRRQERADYSRHARRTSHATTRDTRAELRLGGAVRVRRFPNLVRSHVARKHGQRCPLAQPTRHEQRLLDDEDSESRAALPPARGMRDTAAVGARPEARCLERDDPNRDPRREWSARRGLPTRRPGSHDRCRRAATAPMERRGAIAIGARLDVDAGGSRGNSERGLGGAHDSDRASRSLMRSHHDLGGRRVAVGSRPVSLPGLARRLRPVDSWWRAIPRRIGSVRAWTLGCSGSRPSFSAAWQP